jgi:hypothetical protein
MGSLLKVVRVLSTGLSMLFLANVAVLADDAVAPAQTPQAAAPTDVKPDPAEWQSVITGQIEAFRKGDGATALSFAAQVFKTTFKDPNTFMVSIAASGYTPIFTSVSQSFGAFTQPDAMTVVQVVNLIGPKQELYEAIYALGKEADGWRIEGVQLTKKDSVSV